MPTAIVTGANSGIGNALARILIKEVPALRIIRYSAVDADYVQGYKVIAVDIVIGAPITDLGCETSELDVSSQADIEAFKEKVGDRPIDLLLNVAGTIHPIIFSQILEQK